MQIIDRSNNIAAGIELIDVNLQPMQIRSFFAAQNGALRAPRGFYKLSNTVLEQAHLSYEITSLPEMEIPPLGTYDNELEKQRKTSEFFWLSAHYRFEIVVSYDNGRNWYFRNAIPLKRPLGFPLQTVRLLDLLSDTDIFRMRNGMLVGCRFRNAVVGSNNYGIPKHGFDSMVIHTQGVCEETVYESVQDLVGTATATFTTLVQPAGSNAFSTLILPRAGRKSLAFSSPSAATATFTIRYGAAADTAATSFTLKGGESIAGLANYTGEVSFNQTTAQLNTRVQAIEVVS